MPIEVAVVIVSYNSRTDLGVCLPAVAATRGDLVVHTVVVDCASTDGSADYVREYHPKVDLIVLERNAGYAGGNNVGLSHVMYHRSNAKYVAILNPDTRVEPDWLVRMVELMEQEERVAIVQAKLLLMQVDGHEGDIDSAGNQSHVAGFGFVSAYGEPDDGTRDQVRNLASASGAAMLVRVDALSGEPLFDDTYFMYLEDVELCWRLRLADWSVLYQPAAVVHHRHDPVRTKKQVYYLERNRWRLILGCYKWKTLFVLLPMLAVVECMVLGFALTRGALWAKLRSCSAIFSKHTRTRRRAIQSGRVVSDRELLSRHTPLLDPTAIRNGALRGAVNAVMKVIWALTWPVVRW